MQYHVLAGSLPLRDIRSHSAIHEVFQVVQATKGRNIQLLTYGYNQMLCTFS